MITVFFNKKASLVIIPTLKDLEFFLECQIISHFTQWKA